MNTDHLFNDVQVNGDHTVATVTVEKDVFSRSAVLRACYWFGEKLWFQIKETEEHLQIKVTLRETTSTLQNPKVKRIDEWMPDLFDAFVDSQLRVEIQSETAAIRELIIAKAFAEAGVLEDAPPGTFEDSVEVKDLDKSNHQLR